MFVSPPQLLTPNLVGVRPVPTALIDWVFMTDLPDALTFSRTGNATLFDATGKLTWAPANMAAQSNTFDTTWTKDADVTLTSGAIEGPDGTTSAWLFSDAVSFGYVQQSVTTVADQSYTASLYVKKSTTTGQAGIVFRTVDSSSKIVARLSLSTFALTTEVGGTGVVESSGKEALGNGWYRIWVTGRISSTAGFISVENRSASPQEFYIANAQLEPTSYDSPRAYIATTTSRYYGPRFDYDPVTLQPRGLLMEESRTNSITNSEMVGGRPGVSPTGWGISLSVSGISTTIVNAGHTNGMSFVDFRISGTGATGGGTTIVSFPGSSSASSGQAWSLSYGIELISGNLNGFVLSPRISFTGASTSYGTAYSGSGLELVTFTATAGAGTTAASSNIRASLAAGVAYDFTIRIYTPQLELGTFATSYIPTTSTAVTRATDICYTTSIPWFNQAEGTFVCVGDVLYSQPTHRSYFTVISDGTVSNNISSLVDTNGAPAGRNTISGVLSTSGIDLAQVAPLASLKCGVSYKSGANSVAARGVEASAGAFGPSGVPTGLNKLEIGCGTVANVELNGHIRSFKYWNRALSSTELQRITT